MFKIVPPSPKVQQARLDMIEALRKHDLPPIEMLAVCAYLTGQIIAVQDQTKVTPNAAIELVERNMTAGNRHAVDELMQTKGNG